MGSVITSLSGIRAVTGDTLTPDLVLKWAQAFGTLMKKGPIILGGDTRLSYDLCYHAALSGFISTGTEVIDIGKVPTPTVQQAIQKHQAAGGFILTASHNPIMWNGIKLMNASGSFLNQSDFDQVHSCFKTQLFESVSYDQLGQIKTDPQALDWHIDKILRLLDPHHIKKSSLKVLVDVNHGAGAIATPKLLDRLGVTYDLLGAEPDGRFFHDPEPLKVNLTAMIEKMQTGQYDIGFAQDADADRLVIIDEKGRFIGEDYALAFCIDYILQSEQKVNHDLVVNISTSNIISYLADKYQSTVHYTKIGETNVSQEIRRLSAIAGGEGNGGIIYPKIGWGRDSLVGMVLALKYLSEHRKSVSDIISTYPQYSMVRDKVKVNDRQDIDDLLQKVQDKYKSYSQNTLDGVKITIDDSWLHVRPSNTEPIIRIFAEAPQYDRAFDLVKSVLSL